MTKIVTNSYEIKGIGTVDKVYENFNGKPLPDDHAMHGVRYDESLFPTEGEKILMIFSV